MEQPRVVDGLAARRRPRAADVLPQRDALRDVSVLVAREAALLAARRLQPQVLLALALSVRAQAVARLGALRVALVLPLVFEAPAAASSHGLAQEPRRCRARAAAAATRARSLVAVDDLAVVFPPERRRRKGGGCCGEAPPRAPAVQLRHARAVHARACSSSSFASLSFMASLRWMAARVSTSTRALRSAMMSYERGGDAPVKGRWWPRRASP